MANITYCPSENVATIATSRLGRLAKVPYAWIKAAMASSKERCFLFFLTRTH
jgi:hypothetical protein